MTLLKGEDIVVLLKLTVEPSAWTVRSLEAEIRIPRSVVQRSLVRLERAGLLEEGRRRVSMGRVEELLIHGVKYVFPPMRGGETRGVPTAWAAPPLRDKFADSGELPPVWPDPMGSGRGIALEPLHVSVPEISRRDPALTELLTLIDGIRLGDARVRGVAEDLLRVRLGSASQIISHKINQ